MSDGMSLDGTVAHKHSTSVRVGVALAALMASVSAVPAYAASSGAVANPGFETGDTTGWTTEGGYWNGAWPVPASDYQGNPPTLATVVAAGGTDAITGDPLVFAGNYAMKLNDSGGGNDITALSQSVTNYTGNKLYYAFNATLEPSHGATDSPSFLIKVVDKTTNTIVTNISYSAYSAQNAPTLFRTVGSFVTTDWKVEDITTISGHDYDLLFVAVDCAHGGHGGYVYVDGFGNAIPTPNAGVSFNPATDVLKGASVLIPIGGTTDIDLAQPFYTTSAVAGGTVNPNFVGGTLQVDTAGPVGTAFTIQSQGGTIDTNGADTEFSGPISGVGSLAKAGLGTLTLSNVDTIDGGVTVNAGALNIAGTLSTLAVGVNDGATLLGSGNVVSAVDVNSGGTLAPGAGIGTLNVIGSPVTLNAGSTFALDIDGRNYNPAGGAGSYDRLALGFGASFVAGGTIAPILRGIADPANNTFLPALGDMFTVVAGGVVSGEFSSVTQPASGMLTNQRFDVLYNPKSVQLVVTPGSFATLGAANKWRKNAIAAGAGLDAVRPAAGTRNGALQSLFNGLYGSNANQYYNSLQQLSGEVHVHSLEVARSGVRDATNLALNAAQSTLNANCDDSYETRRTTADGKPITCDGNRMAIWTRLLVQVSHFDSDATATGFSNKEQGFVAGIHVINTADTRIGIGGRYSESTLRTSIGSTADINGYSLFGYASHDFGPFSIGAVLGWNSSDVKALRMQNLIVGGGTSSANYTVDGWNAALEARYDLRIGKRTVIRPVIGIVYDETKGGAVKELNGDPNLALNMTEKTLKTWQSKLGLEAAIGMFGSVTARIGGNWLHTLDGDATAVRAVTLGAAKWNVSSVQIKDDVFEFGAGLAADLSSKAKVRIDYMGTRDGSNFKADRATIGLSLAF